MDHEFIESQQIVDRYLMGRLDPSTEEDFEVHLLSCAACREEVNLTQSFIGGMRATDDTGAQARTPTASSWRVLALAASVMLAVSLSFTAWNALETGKLRRELAARSTITGKAVVVLPLVLTRGNEGDPPNLVELSERSELFVFELEGEYVDDTRYLVSVTNGKEVIWQNELRPDYRGLLLVGVASEQLQDSIYRITVTGPRTGEEIRSFSLRVKSAL